MEIVLLLIIGVFLIYRMMLVEDRMNKLEHNMMNKQNQTPNEDVFWESVKDKVQNDTEYRDTDGWDDELEQQFWKEQPPYPFATDEEVEQLKKEGKL